MRVAKFFDTKKFPLLSEAVDRALLGVDHPWRFQKISFVMDDADYFEIKEEEAEIHLDYAIVYKEDDTYLKAAVMRILFALVSELKGNLTGIKAIDEIIANREMVHAGFGDELFHYYYIKYHQHRAIDTLERYVEDSIPWLSLVGYDSHVLKEIASSRVKDRKTFEHKTKRLFEWLAQDLTAEGVAKDAAKCLKALGE